jgi:hypothetical protein
VRYKEITHTALQLQTLQEECGQPGADQEYLLLQRGTTSPLHQQVTHKHLVVQFLRHLDLQRVAEPTADFNKIQEIIQT